MRPNLVRRMRRTTGWHMCQPEPHHEFARASLRPLRRPVRAGDADAGARRARGRVAVRARGSRRSPGRAGGTLLHGTTSADPRRSTARAGSREAAGHARCGSSARTSTTPVLTRSTTRSARRCSRAGWASTRVIAETGAGQHGVASATACALLDLECVVYMGTEDMRRQRPNVERMQPARRARRRGRRPVPRTLKEAVSAAIRDWVDERRGHALHHRLVRWPGSVSRALVRDLQRVIGDESRAQVLAADRPAARTG